MTTPKSYTQLYIEGCKITNENPEALSIYTELDKLLRYIRTHDSISFETFKAALSEDRICIVIPYEMFRDKRLGPDDILKTGPVMYASPGNDCYISLIIDQMTDVAEPIHFFDNQKQLRKWKIIRLSKMLKLGWTKYCTNYLSL